MRIAAVLLALAAAGPATAQPYLVQPYLGLQARDAQTQADLQALRFRDVQTTNELAALQARSQADQAVGALQAARLPPVVYSAAPPSGVGAYAGGAYRAPLAVIDTSKLISIPDAALAQSNARIRAAAENRR